jgi:hypothetical protein
MDSLALAMRVYCNREISTLFAAPGVSGNSSRVAGEAFCYNYPYGLNQSKYSEGINPFG